MKETIARLLRKPWIAHIIAAVDRFLQRLGPQFAGSVTYFSILSMIPMMMLAVALLGLIVTVVRPDLQMEVQNFLRMQLGSTVDVGGADQETQDFAKSITDFVMTTFRSWRGVFLVALVTGAYAGSRWVKHLKHAVRAMWKDTFAEATPQGNFFGDLIGNLVIFFGLLLSIAVAVGVTTAGQAFPEEIISWLGIQDVPGVDALLQIVSLVVSLLASWLLFAFLFVVLPGERTRPLVFLKGTIAGAVLITALQRLAGELVEIFARNRSISVFGPIIILMLVFNVLSMIILMISAWVGTAETWEADRVKKEARAAAGVDPEDETGIDSKGATPMELVAVTAPTITARRRAERWAAELDPDGLRADNYDPATVRVEDPEALVKQAVAAKTVRVGTRVGYGVGTATGVGLGAIVAALVGRFSRR